MIDATIVQVRVHSTRDRHQFLVGSVLRIGGHLLVFILAEVVRVHPVPVNHQHRNTNFVGVLVD